ncbi:hypothetical protein [Allopontixanthobacter sp.]|uniref:hypothetical protein n=1 Tax=Allopontixanthobacter sp. TaxID=2906452 RepID=UPI002AB9A35D|nr:hypothetical protein [Allopontixanthobacter sp.]MDZ4306974.1 hypothetical protein [Allopontixanthobacter sp.]
MARGRLGLDHGGLRAGVTAQPFVSVRAEKARASRKFKVLIMSGQDALATPGTPWERDARASDPLDDPPLDDPCLSLSPRIRVAQYFQRTLAMRRHRDKRFGQAFTTDRGWDLLLLLMIARLEDRVAHAGEIFGKESPHGVTIEELDRQIGLGNIILIDAGNDLGRSQVVLSDEAARHLIDLYRIDSAAAAC